MEMKRDEHIIMAFFIGILAGVFASNYSEFFHFLDFTLFVGLTILGAIFPDLIEPPKNPNHRRFFHSVLVLLILMILLIWLNVGTQSVFTYLPSGFIVGYLSHLLLDATSRIGLPKY